MLCCTQNQRTLFREKNSGFVKASKKFLLKYCLYFNISKGPIALSAYYFVNKLLCFETYTRNVLQCVLVNSIYWRKNFS